MLPRFSANLALFCAIGSIALAQTFPEWDAVRASYGILTHVAGPAADQDVNSWLPSYEGGLAIEAELSNPHMAQADASGNIYIADKESHSILKVTPAGTIHTVAGTHEPGFNGDGPALGAQLSNPNGLFVLGDGTFYILDLDNGRIRRVGLDGRLTTVVQESGGIGGRALWVSPDEQLIYYAGPFGDRGLRRWTPDGGIELVASGFTSLGNITVDPSGFVIVTEDIGNRVFRIESDGTKTLLAGNGGTSGGGDGFPAVETGLDRVRGVACLPNGGIFLATQKGSHIWYVDTDGLIHKMMDCVPSGRVNDGNGASYSEPGIKMSEPRAITIAPNGDLVITASDYGQVRVVRCLEPPPPPSKLRLEASDTGVLRLRWAGEPWQSYFVERTSSLAPAAWQIIGVRTSEPGGDTLHPLPTVGSASQAFYRVRVPRTSPGADPGAALKPSQQRSKKGSREKGRRLWFK